MSGTPGKASPMAMMHPDLAGACTCVVYSAVSGFAPSAEHTQCEICLQVYGIVSCQLILTAIVAAIIYAVPPVRGFVTTSLAFQLTFAILPLIGELRRQACLQVECPGVFCQKVVERHPLCWVEACYFSSAWMRE